jgi:NNP family nitrate/nitrite transporter-like MFS transporter
MSLATLRRSGHWPTLLAAFLYFDASFCVWYLLGPLATFIAEDLRLGATAKGLLVATPLLGGSLFRIVLGALSDHLGPRRTGLTAIGCTFVPLLLGWLVADSLPTLLVVAILLGIPGASFAVALPLASRWYPPAQQGLVMGIAGAGNSGTVLAALFLPRIAESVGWHAAIGVTMLPMAVAGLVFVFCARESPGRPPAKRLHDYAAVVRRTDVIRFCCCYAITFGGFIGLASVLGILLHDQYGVSRVVAGDLTALCVFAGSFMRPVGGALADRFGGTRLLALCFGAVAVLLLGVARLQSLSVAAASFVAALALLGAGNGAVFQLVGLRFAEEIGIVTGVVGAAGGLGGFFLPSAFGALEDLSGTYASGLVAYSAVCAGGMAFVVAGAWRLAWGSAERTTTGAALRH